MRPGPVAPPDPAAFAATLDALGPFEPRPTLAIGLSGGADSLGLLVLALAWARERGGTVGALCVSHRLRPESDAEAAAAAAQASALGAAWVQVLPWPDHQPRPIRRVQEQARAVRLDLLLDACAAAGVLHLVLAHHRDDQAETVIQRLGRGSGPRGLAAMAAVTVRPQARILRPLLTTPKAALEALCRARGLTWVCDPSNQDPNRQERARLRQGAARTDSMALGLAAPALVRTAARCDRARIAAETCETRLLARLVVAVGPGWLVLDQGGLTAAAATDPARLAGALAWAAGSLAGAERAADALRLEDGLIGAWPPPGKARSLAGCLWRAVRGGGGGGRVIVCREARRDLDHPWPLPAGRVVLWDGRWRLSVPQPGLAVVARGGRVSPLSGPRPGPMPASAPVPDEAAPALALALRLEGVPPPDRLPRPAGAALPRLVVDPCGVSQGVSQGVCGPGTGDRGNEDDLFPVSPADDRRYAAASGPSPAACGGVVGGPSGGGVCPVAVYRPRLPLVARGLRLEPPAFHPYLDR